MLAEAAKSDTDIGSALDAARNDYVRALQDDAEDIVLTRSTAALVACDDVRCAGAALASEPFGERFRQALPDFTAIYWSERATAAWAGIEAAHASLGPASEQLLANATASLGITWPEAPVVVDVVAGAPPPSRAALVPMALSTRSRCFVRGRKEDLSLGDARLLDCVLVHALIHAQSSSRDELVRRLGPRDGERAFTLLVIHAAAVLVTGLERKHVSIYRHGAATVEPDRLAWLSTQWVATREPPGTFAIRYAAMWSGLSEPSP